MRRVAILAGAFGLLSVAAAYGQRPSVSPILERAVGRDTTVTVWLFARPDVSLTRIATFVVQSGGTVRRRSRWLHAVSAELPATAFAAARSRRDLRRIQPVRRFARRPAAPPPAPPLELRRVPAQDTLFGPSAMPFRRLNLFPLVDRGIDGAGVRIAILDSGFETELPAFASVHLRAQYDFVFNDSIVRNEANDDAAASTHGTQVFSLFAANLPGTLIGIAPAATYLLAKTEDVRSETQVEEDNYVAALEWSDSIGVDIVSSSIGYSTFEDGTGYTIQDLNGDIAVTTVAADMAAERGILVVTAMGNGGASGATSMITPADGDSVLAVGAEDSTGVVAAFSSRGPTADGRVKPDLAAPGVAVLVATPDGAGGTTFVRVNGTSFATPIVAAAAALLRQVQPGFLPIDLLEVLRGAADNRAAPDNDRGWGRPDVALAATFPRGITVTTPGSPELTSITPTFAWSAPFVPNLALPVTYRFRAARDTTYSTILLDTTLTDSSVTLLDPQFPGETLVFELTATAADSVVIRLASDIPLTIPPWVELQTLSDPGGVTVRDLRPRLTWSAPDVAVPPGPFLFDISIIRAADGVIELIADSLSVTSFVPSRDLERNTPYRWQVTARLGQDSVTVRSQGTFLIVDDSSPPLTTLFQNFPNPFPNIGQNATCIWFDLAVAGFVSLDILDLRGHVVRSLIPVAGLRPPLRPGRYGRPSGQDGPRCDGRLEWDGTAANGGDVPAGIYLMKLVTPDGTFFKRIVYLGRGQF